MSNLINPYIFATPGDPYWADVVSLLNFNSNLTDEKGNVWTATGGAAADANGLELNGSSQLIHTPGIAGFAFGTGDFTIEMILTATNNNCVPLDFYNGAGAGNTSWQLGIDTPTPDLLMYAGAVIGEGTHPVSSGVQHHIAYARQGTTMRGFVDGVLDSTTTNSRNFSTVTPYLAVGGQFYMGAGSYLAGKVRAMRLTAGVARYTAAFTPPAWPLPNHG